MASKFGQLNNFSDSSTRGRASNQGFHGYTDYFHHKELQQLENDEKFRIEYQRKNRIENKTLFRNCTLYVNGRTSPSRLELHKLIILHGGRFKHYLSGKNAATHIIATELNASKRVQFANYKVVDPSWVIESIAHGKLLPWQDYKIITASKLQKEISTYSNILNCMDPKFIRSFFENSRLHHLSNWKFQLREKFVKEFLSAEKSLTKDNTNNNTSFVYFHVDFDCFFAQVSATVDGRYDINATPIAICHGKHNSDISSCNYKARSFGVRNGMWVSSALKICPNLKLLSYEFEEYAQISTLFYKALNSIEQFEMVLPISIDEAIACMKITPDVTESLLENICKKIRASVFDHTQGYTVSVGCSKSLLLARLALRKGKPDNYHVGWFSCLGEIHRFIDDFQLNDLPGVGYSTTQKIFEEFGRLNSILELRSIIDLPDGLNRLVKRIGSKNAMRLKNAIQGRDDDEAVKMVNEPKTFFQKKSISVEINYAIRFESIDQVDLFLDRLAHHLWEKLTECGKLTGQITLKLMKRANGAPLETRKFMGMGICDALSKASTLGTSTNKFGTIASECKTLFRLLSVPPRDVRGVGIQFNKLIEVVEGDTNPSSGMFDDFFKKRENKTPTIADPHTPKNTIYASPIKDYWHKHLKRNRIPVEFAIPENLDPDFMANLPPDICEELQSAHKVVKKVNTSLKSKVLEEESRLQVVKTQDLDFIHDGRLMLQLKFQGIASIKQISKLLIDWVDITVEKGPHSKDLELFVAYLSKLSSQGRCHIILQLVRTIKDRINEYGGKNFRGLSEWEYHLLRSIVPILNQSRSKLSYQLSFDL